MMKATTTYGTFAFLSLFSLDGRYFFPENKTEMKNLGYEAILKFFCLHEKDKISDALLYLRIQHFCI